LRAIDRDSFFIVLSANHYAMPIYQYRCDECHHPMEALQKMSDPKLVDCPECMAPALKKQVTAAAFKLKGAGWYETDFKNSGAKPKAEKSGETNAVPDKTDVGSTSDGEKTKIQTASPKESASSTQ